MTVSFVTLPSFNLYLSNGFETMSSATFVPYTSRALRRRIIRSTKARIAKPAPAVGTSTPTPTVILQEELDIAALVLLLEDIAEAVGTLDDVAVDVKKV